MLDPNHIFETDVAYEGIVWDRNFQHICQLSARSIPGTVLLRARSSYMTQYRHVVGIMRRSRDSMALYDGEYFGERVFSKPSRPFCYIRLLACKWMQNWEHPQTNVWHTYHYRISNTTNYFEISYPEEAKLTQVPPWATHYSLSNSTAVHLRGGCSKQLNLLFLW